MLNFRKKAFLVLEKSFLTLKAFSLYLSSSFFVLNVKKNVFGNCKAKQTKKYPFSWHQFNPTTWTLKTFCNQASKIKKREKEVSKNALSSSPSQSLSAERSWVKYFAKWRLKVPLAIEKLQSSSGREHWTLKVSADKWVPVFLVFNWPLVLWKKYFVFIKTTYSSRYSFVACNSRYA